LLNPKVKAGNNPLLRDDLGAVATEIGSKGQPVAAGRQGSSLDGRSIELPSRILVESVRITARQNASSRSCDDLARHSYRTPFSGLLTGLRPSDDKMIDDGVAVVAASMVSRGLQVNAIDI
jgi:hypothetical protein